MSLSNIDFQKHCAPLMDFMENPMVEQGDRLGLQLSWVVCSLHFITHALLSRTFFLFLRLNFNQNYLHPA